MGIGDFKGKKIILTGAFMTMKRTDTKKVLTEQGATVTGSVSSKTDILVYREKAGSKLT